MPDTADVGHQVRNVTLGVGELLLDVVVRKDVVDTPQNTRLVLVNVADPDMSLVGGGDGTQVDFGEVDSTEGSTVVQVSSKSVGNFGTDGSLSFLGRTTDVRSEDEVGNLSESRDEVTESLVKAGTIGSGLLGEDVDGSTGEMVGFEGVTESREVDNLAAGVVDEEGTLLHLRKLLGTHHTNGVRDFRDMQGDEISPGEEILKGVNLAG